MQILIMFSYLYIYINGVIYSIWKNLLRLEGIMNPLKLFSKATFTINNCEKIKRKEY